MPNGSNKLTAVEREELAHPPLEPTVTTCVKALKYIEELEHSLKEVERSTLLADLKHANAVLARAEAAEATITKLNIMYGGLVRAAQEMMHVDLLNRREFHSVHLDLEKALCSLRSNGVIK